MRYPLVLSLALSLPGCYATVDNGRTPAHVDPAKPPDDLRRRVEPPKAEAQTEKHREVVLVQAPRIGARKVEGQSTTWGFGGDVSGWYGSAATMGGVRAGATYVRDRGVTDATFGPAFGFPVLGNIGAGWAVDPIKRAHGAHVTAELGGLSLRYTRFPGLDEHRIEVGIIFPFGLQSFSWYR